MEKLSVVIITYNEQENIATCIKSVASVADEIVVLDSFSTDRTQLICESLGATFFQHNFDGHIQQKNRVITYASHNLVLSLDADEALSEELAASILEVKRNRQAEGYKFNRLNHYCGKPVWHGGWYPDSKLRLWEKTEGEWAGINPHDEFFMHKGARIQKIKGDLMHYTFHTYEQHLEQVRKFAFIKAEQAQLKGKKSNYITLLFKPIYVFIRSYFLKFGFLDGFNGVLIAVNSAYGFFLLHVKMLIAQRTDKQK